MSSWHENLSGTGEVFYPHKATMQSWKARAYSISCFSTRECRLTWLTLTHWMGDPIDPIDDGGTISWWFEKMQEALSSLFSLDAGHRVVVPGLQNRWQDGMTYGSEQLPYCKKVSFSLHCWREGFQTSHCQNYIQFPSWGGHMIFNFLIWCGFEKCMTLRVFCCCPKVHNFGTNADIPSIVANDDDPGSNSWCHLISQSKDGYFMAFHLMRFHIMTMIGFQG